MLNSNILKGFDASVIVILQLETKIYVVGAIPNKIVESKTRIENTAKTMPNFSRITR